MKKLKRMIKKHIMLELKEKPELVAIRELRKPLAWYTKGLKNSSEFRDKINMIEEKNELLYQIDKYFNQIKQSQM